MSAPTVDRRGSVLRPDPVVLAGTAVALGCTFVGQYVQTPWRTGSDGWGIDFADGGGWGALALLMAFVVVATLGVSAVVTAARAAGPEAASRRAVLLAVVGVASVAVFWTGLPAILAAGAISLGVLPRRPGRPRPAAVVALVLGALTVAAAVWLAVTG